MTEVTFLSRLISIISPPWGKALEPTPPAVKSHGLTCIANPQNAAVDLVAIHGLGGHPERSWTASNNKMWLRDFLVDDVPDARILSYGYDSFAASSRYLVRQILFSEAENLLLELCHLREKSNTKGRPIIFLAHSLGGILLKSALIRSKSAIKKLDIYTSTTSIVFFGTPHRGSGTGDTALPWAKLIERNFISMLPQSSMLVRTFHKDSEWLEMRLEQFKSISNGFHIRVFYETIPTDRVMVRVVPKDAALMSDPSFGNEEKSAELLSNHLDIIKFASSDDPNYVTVLNCLRKICAPSVLQSKKSWNGNASPELSQTLYNTLANSGAQSNPYKIPFSIPFPRNQNFTGREKDIEQCLRMTEHHQSTAFTHGAILITGKPGVGKTELVTEFLYRRQDRFTLVAWIDASNLQSMQTSFIALAERIMRNYVARTDSQKLSYAVAANFFGCDATVDGQGRLHLNQKSPSILLNAVKQWLGRSENNGWLLVFDNVKDFKDVCSFLPGLLNGRIILISRSKWPQDIEETLDVAPMLEDECIQLFRQESWTNTTETNDEDFVVIIRHIIRNLGDLPLDVSFARSCTLRRHFTIRELRVLCDNTGPEVSMPLRASSVTLGQAFSASWKLALKRLNKRSVDLLYSCSYMSPDDCIPLSLLSRGLKFGDIHDQDFMEILNPLLHASLVFRADGSDTIRIHRLVQMAAREHFSATESSRYNFALERVFLLISTSLAHSQRFESETGSTEGRQLEQSALPHLISCFRNASDLLTDISYFPNMDGKAWNLLASICEWHDRLGEAKTFYNLALMNVERSRDKPSELPADEMPLLRKIRWGLGSVCKRQRADDEAECRLQAAINEPAGNHDDRIVWVKAACQLSALYTHQNRLDEAEALDSKALAIVDDILGANHPFTVDMLKSVSARYRERGQLEKSEMLKRREVLALEVLYGQDHLSTIEAFRELAISCADQTRWDEAEALMTRVHDELKRWLGTEHLSTLQASKRLATILASQGRFDAAEALYKQTLDRESGLLGRQGNFYKCETLGLLADLWTSSWILTQDRSHLEKAKELCEQLRELQMTGGHWGQDDRKRPEAVIKLAKMLERAGDEDGALKLLKLWAENNDLGPTKSQR